MAEKKNHTENVACLNEIGSENMALKHCQGLDLVTDVQDVVKRTGLGMTLLKGFRQGSEKPEKGYGGYIEAIDAR